MLMFTSVIFQNRSSDRFQLHRHMKKKISQPCLITSIAHLLFIKRSNISTWPLSLIPQVATRSLHVTCALSCIFACQNCDSHSNRYLSQLSLKRQMCTKSRMKLRFLDPAWKDQEEVEARVKAKWRPVDVFLGNLGCYQPTWQFSRPIFNQGNHFIFFRLYKKETF